MNNFYRRLILYPLAPLNGDPPRLQQFLRKIGFVADKWHFQNQDYYLAGDRFFNAVMFLGCAPHINTRPSAAGELPDNFVAIKLAVKCYQSMVFYPGKPAFTLLCRFCKKDIGFPAVSNLSAMVDCPHCGQVNSLLEKNYRHQAGISNYFIEIMGIFEGEAVPSDALMTGLARESNGKWNYFYADDKAMKTWPIVSV